MPDLSPHHHPDPEHRHDGRCTCYRPAPPPVCHHDHTQPPLPQSGSAAKWLAAGVGGSFLALALALSFIAVAIGAVALTVCVVVLRGVWADVSKGR